MTYESAVVLRAEARAVLEVLSRTVEELNAHLDFDQRVELTAWIGEGRRLLHGEQAPPALPAPPNVIPIRKFVCVRKPAHDFFGLVAPERTEP